MAARSSLRCTTRVEHARRRISTATVLSAVVLLICTGCFNASVPPNPVSLNAGTRASNEQAEALLVEKRAVDDAWKACSPAMDHSLRECEQLCPIDLPVPEIRGLTAKELLDRLPEKCVESHGSAWLGGIDDAQSLPSGSYSHVPQSGRPCDVVATEQLKKYGEGAALDRAARECERVCPIDLPLPEIRSLSTKELIDRISQLCAQGHYECLAVSNRKDNAGLLVVAEDGLGVLENIDPACDAAIHLVRVKEKALDDANFRVRSYYEQPVAPITSCVPTPGGGFDCYNW
jgi:hypothetical protein